MTNRESELHFGVRQLGRCQRRVGEQCGAHLVLKVGVEAKPKGGAEEAEPREEEGQGEEGEQYTGEGHQGGGGMAHSAGGGTGKGPGPGQVAGVHFQGKVRYSEG